MKLLIILLILIIWVVFIEPYILTVKTIKIQDKGLAGLKIIFATDLHYKTYEKFRLKRDVKKINAQNPDIILLGGDYVNGHKQGSALDHKIIGEEFGKLKSKYGTFVVLGNHDVWQDAAGISESLRENNITVLKNSNAKAGNVFIAGVEDLQTQRPDVEKALKNTKPPIILLTHTPDMIEKIPENVNLTLAGHLHGGQINFPFHGAIVAPSRCGPTYAYGLFDVNGRKLFVSRGIGTSILPIRFLCPPEIVVIEFVN